ncbi:MULTISPECIES: thermonuclease family protein [unclassified Luteococcus]|uniref:thermonuclease family protein n=1 Tax=unclassified Luteococcus TaxID=2639923 RepID=UPI00313DF710
MTSRARGEVIAALLVVCLFCAIVGPVWWQRWREGTLGSATSAAPVPTPPLPGREAATVVRVSDGDTVVVRRGGREETVRILNIDTPETHKRGTAVECLGPEATTALTRLLPKGTAVELAHDGPRRDRYGRTLAALWADGRLLSAEMARQGLTGAVVVSRADTFLAPVAAAQQEAMTAHRGLYDPAIACTLAGQTRARVQALQSDDVAKLRAAIAPAQALRQQLATPDSKIGAVQRQRHPAAWRQARVDELDEALTRAARTVR